MLTETWAASKSFPRSSAISDAQRLVVYADDLATANTVRLEGDRVAEAFSAYFKLESIKYQVPIILAIGAEDPAAKKDEGKGIVRVFPHEKLQINWDSTPISRESFQRGMVRALCIRLAMLTQPVPKNKKDAIPDLRVPMWMTQGVANLVAGPYDSQRHVGSAILLSRLKPNLSWGEAMAELEGKSRLDDFQNAIATSICNALLQDQMLRPRFLHFMNWEKEMTMQKWMKLLLGKKEPEEWWRETWRDQARQFSWVKLGYYPTLNWILEQEENHHFNFVDWGADVTNIAHPWFRRWVSQRLSDENRDLLENKLLNLREDIELRRLTALQWFGEVRLKETPSTRQDFLAWTLAHPHVDSTVPANGPINTWLDGLIKNQSKK